MDSVGTAVATVGEEEATGIGDGAVVFVFRVTGAAVLGFSATGELDGASVEPPQLIEPPLCAAAKKDENISPIKSTLIISHKRVIVCLERAIVASSAVSIVTGAPDDRLACGAFIALAAARATTWTSARDFGVAERLPNSLRKRAATSGGSSRLRVCAWFLRRGARV